MVIYDILICSLKYLFLFVCIYIFFFFGGGGTQVVGRSFGTKPPCQSMQHLMQAIIRHIDNASLIITALHCHWQAIIRHTQEKRQCLHRAWLTV